MGELHLEIIVDRMKREYGVQAHVGKPQVVYPRDRARGWRGQLDVRARAQGADDLRRGHVPGGDAAARLGHVDSRDAGGRAPAARGRASRGHAGPARRGHVRARRLSARGRRGDADGHRDPRGRATAEIAVRAAASEAFRRAVRRRPAGAARADHDGRGHRARGVPRRVSSATSTSATGRCRSRRGRRPRSVVDGAWCRCATCSATRPGCARCPRDARPTRCSSAATTRSAASTAGQKSFPSCGGGGWSGRVYEPRPCLEAVSAPGTDRCQCRATFALAVHERNSAASRAARGARSGYVGPVWPAGPKLS